MCAGCRNDDMVAFLKMIGYMWLALVLFGGPIALAYWVFH